MTMPIPPYETVVSWFKGLLPMFKRGWQFLSGPAIDAKLLNPVNFVYALEVRNVRGRAVVPRVFLDEVTEATDRHTGAVTSSIEIFHVANRAEWPRLFGEARVLFNILGVDWTHRAGAALYVYALEDREQNDRGVMEKIKQGKRWLVPPAPIGEQKEIRLTIRVVFCSTDDPQVELMDKVFRYSVTPLPASGEYRVRLIKPRHASIFG